MKIFTDGSCLGSVGPGGWAFAIVRNDGSLVIQHGGESETNSQAMETRAVLEALRALRKPRQVDLYSDSKCLVEMIKHYYERGIDRGTGQDHYLWADLTWELEKHDVTPHWIRRESHKLNCLCDHLARQESGFRKFLQSQQMLESLDRMTFL